MTRSLVGGRGSSRCCVHRARGRPSPAQPADEPPYARSRCTTPVAGCTSPPGRWSGWSAPTPTRRRQVADRLGRSRRRRDRVTLGGVPLADLPLATVRRRVLVSEAEPRLFTGALRDELDPWGGAGDDGDAARGAARRRRADDVLDALPDGLDAERRRGAAGRSPAGSGSGSRWPAPLLADPRGPGARRADQRGRRAHRGCASRGRLRHGDAPTARRAHDGRDQRQPAAARPLRRGRLPASTAGSSPTRHPPRPARPAPALPRRPSPGGRR